MNTEFFKNLKIDSEMCWKLCIMFCLMAIIMVLPDVSIAADPAAGAAGKDAISNTLCKIVIQLTGPVGRAIATVAVVFVGIGLFLGKMSWGLAIAVGIGIGAIFGAATIVSFLDPSGSTEKCEAA